MKESNGAVAVIDVRVDDLAFYEGEAIARPVNAMLGATTPVMRKLERAAGASFTEKARLSEPLPVGAAVVTNAGDLQVELLIHGVVSSEDEAVKLVQALLDRRLIACGTLVPGARSLYRWQGKIADEREVLLLLKTRSARVQPLQAAFKELHPYKVPELLVLSVDSGLEQYIEWINGETSLSLT